MTTNTSLAFTMTKRAPAVGQDKTPAGEKNNELFQKIGQKAVEEWVKNHSAQVDSIRYGAIKDWVSSNKERFWATFPEFESYNFGLISDENAPRDLQTVIKCMNVVQKLGLKNSDIHMKDQRKNTILSEAVYKGRSDIITFLFSQSDIFGDSMEKEIQELLDRALDLYYTMYFAQDKSFFDGYVQDSSACEKVVKLFFKYAVDRDLSMGNFTSMSSEISRRDKLKTVYTFENAVWEKIKPSQIYQEVQKQCSRIELKPKEPNKKKQKLK